MANVSKRRNGEFLRVVFKLLWNEQDGIQGRDILDHVGQTMDLTEYEKGFYPSAPNSLRFEKIVRFATIALVKAGWLAKAKGYWILTEDGRDAFNTYKDPEGFYGEADRLYREWKKRRPMEDDLESLNTEEDIQSITITFEEAEENAWEQINRFLQSIGPYEFQDLVAELLIAMNYHVNWVAPPGKDKGIDIIVYSDPLGTSIPRIKVQVKHRIDNPTNVEGLRAFMSTLGTDEVGIFFSSGGFTRDAREEARTQESRKITLIDLQRFFDLWIEHRDNLRQDARQIFPLKPIYYLSPEE